jgi:hypothetical protein
MKRLVIFAAGILFSAGLLAFWSIGIPVHADITSEALRDSFEFKKGNITYKERVFSQLKTANINILSRNQDITAVVGYDALDHFDSETLLNSTQRLLHRKAQLIVELEGMSDAIIEQELSSGNHSSAYYVNLYLGQILHAAQDFYAHTSWVENGNTYIINFGNPYFRDTAEFQALASAEGGKGSSTPARCTQTIHGSDIWTTLISVLFSNKLSLTSGYYNTVPAAGKCAHGNESRDAPLTLGTVALGRCTSLLLLPKDGINLDLPCFDDDFVPIHHDQAKRLAIKESRALVQSVVDKLQSDGNSFGFCRLLGLPLSDQLCLVEAIADQSPRTLVPGTPIASFSPFTNVVGGSPPYHYSKVSGSLPTGIEIDANTGVVSGTATAAVTPSTVIFQLEDSSGVNPPLKSSVTFSSTGIFSGSITKGVFWGTSGGYFNCIYSCTHHKQENLRFQCSTANCPTSVRIDYSFNTYIWNGTSFALNARSTSEVVQVRDTQTLSNTIDTIVASGYFDSYLLTVVNNITTGQFTVGSRQGGPDEYRPEYSFGTFVIYDSSGSKIGEGSIGETSPPIAPVPCSQPSLYRDCFKVQYGIEGVFPP